MHLINTYSKFAGAWLRRKLLFNLFIMENFVKLTRAEMKNILGGELHPCQDECKTDDDCNTGSKSGTCQSTDGLGVCPAHLVCS